MVPYLIFFFFQIIPPPLTPDEQSEHYFLYISKNKHFIVINFIIYLLKITSVNTTLFLIIIL